ncbi:glycosyl hydrolases family 16 domain-containing protein [Hirsutella rhossiliensis]|uniref:Glycosyl hydrolases family 16 domain-containing protein n=1 Tax=Hirsutella rhossiliensis TaxID=111463 RepID=A0A9P8SL50_9HYPO|nr:glycosyl hydrolases family 16 domain-containing protein [Hirsutella rhossiliensis]KAH0965450.1 glycosyl hydrolases family 16 domain-containing protein [Hirsutella rhossiliensis]
MLRNILLAASMAIRALGSLKDLAHCDPLRKDMRCPPDPAFAGKASFNFSTTGWDQKDLEDFWEIDNDTVHDRRRLGFGTAAEGVAVGVWKAADAPTLVSRKYMLFGKVSVTVKAAKGQGIVTAITLKSDSGDEIDWELLGAYEKQAASNYFYDGKALFNTYNDTYPLPTSSYDAYHTYTIEWTDTRLVLSIDAAPRKTWRLGDNFLPPGAWPQTPMQLKLGVWSVANGTAASDPGEVRWAGGPPDWEGSGAPFVAHFAAVEVEDYMGGCTRARDGAAVRYRYDERTVGWRHVLVDGCEERVPGADLATASPSAAGEPGPTPTAEAGAEGGQQDEDDAAVLLGLSSPLAAIVCLCWLLVL